MVEPTQKMIETAHKVVFLVQQYPDKDLNQIIAALQMPEIDINVGIWLAVELGYLKDPAADGVMTLLKLPEQWQFGENVDHLITLLTYAFAQLSEKEKDVEENNLSKWTFGYPGHDTLIALKWLLNNGVLGKYALTDPEDLKSTYTFYTQYGNESKIWGNKQFKVPPTGNEIPDTSDVDDTPEEDKLLRKEQEDKE